MLKSDTKRFEGLGEVTVTQFPGRKNLDILVDLAALVGPAIAAAAPKDGPSKKGSLLDADIDLSKVANALFMGMDSKKVGDLVMRLLSATFVDNRPLDSGLFDSAFAGPNLMKLPGVLMFVLAHNFGDFSALVGSVSQVSGQKKADQAQAD
jgi:hypothetical protein